MKFNRRNFLESLAAAFGIVAGAVGLEMAAVAPKSELVAKPLAIPATGVLVVEFDAARFPHRDDGAYHGGVIGALRHIRNGREIFTVGGQCIFPVYRDGNPTAIASVILIPQGFQARSNGYFGDAPKVRWLGGDKFERIA